MASYPVWEVVIAVLLLLVVPTVADLSLRSFLRLLDGKLLETPMPCMLIVFPSSRQRCRQATLSSTTPPESTVTEITTATLASPLMD